MINTPPAKSQKKIPTLAKAQNDDTGMMTLVVVLKSTLLPSSWPSLHRLTDVHCGRSGPVRRFRLWGGGMPWVGYPSIWKFWGGGLWWGPRRPHMFGTRVGSQEGGGGRG